MVWDSSVLLREYLPNRSSERTGRIAVRGLRHAHRLGLPSKRDKGEARYCEDVNPCLPLPFRSDRALIYSFPVLISSLTFRIGVRLSG
jgi:hypothetical protein